jgi:membrane protein involved in colicin uptake
MARKARKKSTSRAKKKSAAVTRKKRKTVAKKKSRRAARKQAARKAKPKGVIATIVGDFEAVVDTLSEAERLHRKLEPRGSPESEQ